MADNKPKYPFRRRLDHIKDIVRTIHGGDPKKLSSLIDGLAKITSVENLFSQTGNTINIGNNLRLSSVSLKELQTNPLAIGGENRYFIYLFPSDLVRALTHLINIFADKGISGLSEFNKGELVKVKSWGNFDTGYKTIDETAFIEHYEDIRRMLGVVVNTYRAHKNILDTTETIKKTLSDDDLKKLIAALEKEPGATDADKQNKIIPESADIDKDHTLTESQTAVVPPTSPKTDGGKKTSATTQKDGLTANQKRKIQYEVAWMYNRSVYEMFTAYGIKTEDINPALLENLKTDIFKFTTGMSQKDLGLMFGSASKRQAALLKFYPRFGKDNASELGSFYQETIKKEDWQLLSKEQRGSFTEFHANIMAGQAAKKTLSTGIFEESLSSILSKETGVPSSDSPALNKNIQNTLDAMILQYGINQEFFTTDESGELKIISATKNNHDVISVINSMSAQKLAIVFGIPNTIKVSDVQLAKLQKILTNYATQRASELTLHIQDVSLSRGLMSLDSQEAKKLKNGDSETNIKHLSFTSNTRAAIDKNGAETVIGGIEVGKDDRRKDKIDKINKQYKTFIPLWSNLSAKEQRIVYNKFGIPFDKGMDKDHPLEFIPDFLLFDISTLKTFKNIEGSDKFTAEEQDLFEEFIEINQQLSAEYQYSLYLTYTYMDLLEADQKLAMTDHLNGGEALGDYPSMTFFSNFSNRQIMEAEQITQGSGWTISNNNKQLAKREGFFGKLRKRFGKKNLDPTQKISRAFGKSVAFKKLANLSNLVIPGKGGQLLYALGKKIGFKNAFGLMGFGLALLIGKTLHALSTIGGLIGGILGGAAGFLAAGPAGIIPGVIAGANIGQAIMPANWFNSLVGGETSAATAEAINLSENAAVQVATANKIAAASDIFFGLSISILAPGTTMVIALAVTVYVIFTIQSAFLVPMPKSLDPSDWGSANSYKCNAASVPKPTNEGVIMSSDGKYAYPMIKTNYDNVNSCYHWDRTLAIDIFTEQNIPTNPQENLPLVAYTSGTISMVVPNDDYGGLYIILQGDDNDDGRYYYYAHLCTSYVQNGQKVVAGEVIGTTNQSGVNAEVTPEHLHFAIQEGGTQPEFYKGGNVCPFTDIREKFSMASCPKPEWECLPKGESF